MTDPASLHDYLVLSRGQWDADKSKQEVQAAIDAFYVWYEALVAQGRIKRGHRLAREGRSVSRHRITDNPCMACGLAFEVRPIELERASAYRLSNETPRG